MPPKTESQTEPTPTRDAWDRVLTLLESKDETIRELSAALVSQRSVALMPPIVTEAQKVIADLGALRAQRAMPTTFREAWGIADVQATDVDAFKADGSPRRAFSTRVRFVDRHDGRGLISVTFENTKDDEEMTSHCFVEELKARGALSEYLSAKADVARQDHAQRIWAEARPSALVRRMTYGMLPASRALISQGQPAHRYLGPAAVRARCMSFKLVDRDGHELDDNGVPLATAAEAAE